jgi:hypothetical protein
LEHRKGNSVILFDWVHFLTQYLYYVERNANHCIIISSLFPRKDWRLHPQERRRNSRDPPLRRLKNEY